MKVTAVPETVVAPAIAPAAVMPPLCNANEVPPIVVKVAAVPETVEAAVIAPDTFKVLPRMVAPTTSSVLEAEMVVNVAAPAWATAPETFKPPPI